MDLSEADQEAILSINSCKLGPDYIYNFIKWGLYVRITEDVDVEKVVNYYSHIINSCEITYFSVIAKQLSNRNDIVEIFSKLYQKVNKYLFVFSSKRGPMFLTPIPQDDDDTYYKHFIARSPEYWVFLFDVINQNGFKFSDNLEFDRKTGIQSFDDKVDRLLNEIISEMKTPY